MLIQVVQRVAGRRPNISESEHVRRGHIRRLKQSQRGCEVLDRGLVVPSMNAAPSSSVSALDRGGASTTLISS